MALSFIESSAHRRVKLMNDCLQQCDFIDNLSSSLGSTSVVSLVQIQTLQNKYSQLEEQFNEFRPFIFNSLVEQDDYPAEFFSCVQNKTDAFFKKHTVLVKVYCDATWGHALFILGLNGDWRYGHKLTLENTCNWSIRIPKPCGNNCIEFKIVRKPANSSTLEWQPTVKNSSVSSRDEEFKMTVNGPFSKIDSWKTTAMPTTESNRNLNNNNNNNLQNQGHQNNSTFDFSDFMQECRQFEESQRRLEEAQSLLRQVRIREDYENRMRQIDEEYQAQIRPLQDGYGGHFVQNSKPSESSSSSSSEEEQNAPHGSEQCIIF